MQLGMITWSRQLAEIETKNQNEEEGLFKWYSSIVDGAIQAHLSISQTAQTSF